MLTKLHSGNMILLSNRVVGRETFVVRQYEFFLFLFFFFFCIIELVPRSCELISR